MARGFIGATLGVGGRSGAPDASPGATTIPGASSDGGMHNPRVLYIWLGALLVLYVFHVGGASLGGGA